MSLGLATLLVSGPAWAQEAGRTPGGALLLPPPPSPSIGDPSPNGIVADLVPSESAPADERGPFFMGEYLLLRARRQYQDIAILDPANNGIPEGSIQSLDWEVNSGLRIGGGWHLAEDWSVGAYYTYFHANDGRTVSRPLNGALYATLTHPGTIEQVDTVSAGSSLNYNVFDIELAKQVPLGETVAIKLTGGPRFACIDQSLTAFYNGGDATGAMVSSPSCFDGAGIRIGGECSMRIARSFSLYGHAHGSLLVGDFCTSLLETNNNGATVLVNVTDRFEKVVPVTEFGLGIAWQREYLRLTVSYELANWFGVVDSPDFGDDIHQGKLNRRVGDLTLDGLAVRAELRF